MKKEKMTKKEKLAIYKAEKAAAKLKKEQHTLLAKYLSESACVYVTNMKRCYHHDCILLPVSNNGQEFEQRIKMLYGECKLMGNAPGRFTFSPSEFFAWAKNTNPHLWGVVPSVLYSLYLENLIDFHFIEEKENPSLGETTAIFKIKLI